MVFQIDSNFNSQNPNGIVWERIRTTAADDYFDQHVTRVDTIVQKSYGLFFYFLKHWNWISRVYHWAVGTDATLHHLKITAKDLVEVFFEMNSSQAKCDCFFQKNRNSLLIDNHDHDKEKLCALSKAWDEFCNAFTRRCSHLKISLASACSISFDDKCVTELSQKLVNLCQKMGPRINSDITGLTEWIQWTIGRKLFQNRWYQLAWVSPDIHIEIIPRLAPKDIVSLSCVSKRLNQDVSICLSKISDVALLKICRNLTIIDTDPGEKPPTDYFEVVKGAHAFAPLIEEDSGLTLLILREGLTLDHVEQVGKEVGIRITVLAGGNNPADLSCSYWKYSKLSIEKTHSFLITDKCLKGTDTMSREERLQLANQYRCGTWTLLAMVALYVFAFQKKGIRLFKDQNNQRAISYTSFCSKETFLSVVDYDSKELWITGDDFSNEFPDAIRGVRGQRMVDRIDYTPVTSNPKKELANS